nr:MAG TPA: cell division protein [Bacteriophage sp.]
MSDKIFVKIERKEYENLIKHCHTLKKALNEAEKDIKSLKAAVNKNKNKEEKD